MKISAFSYLRRVHQRRLWEPALWIAAAGLAADLMLAHLQANAPLRLETLTGAALFAGLVWLWSMRPLIDTARALDVSLRTSNRLESLVASAAPNNLVAQALQSEADVFLSRQRLPRPWSWWLALTVGLALVGVEGFKLVQLARTRAPSGAIISASPGEPPSAANEPPALRRAPFPPVLKPPLSRPPSRPAAARPLPPLKKLVLQLPGIPPGLALIPRNQTAAGRLERFAAQQHLLVGRIASGKEAPSLLAQEGQMARELRTLANGTNLPAQIRAEVRNAAEQALAAAHQLNARDLAAASEPAALAEQTLARAAAKLDAMGRAAAVAKLAEVQRDLIRAATEAQNAPGVSSARAAQAAVAQASAGQQAIAKEAQNQQAQGSANAARQLAALSDAMNARSGSNTDKRGASGGDSGSGGSGGSSKSGNSGSPSGLSGSGSSGNSGSSVDRSPASDQLIAMAQDTADTASRLVIGPSDFRVALDLLHLERDELQQSRILGPTALTKIYENVIAAAQTMQAQGIPDPPPMPGPQVASLGNYQAQLRAHIAGLIALANNALVRQPRDHPLSVADPADAPPEYRSAVAGYFEALARRASAADSPPTPRQ